MTAQLRPVVIRTREDKFRVARELRVLDYVPGRFGWFVLEGSDGEPYRIPNDSPDVLNRHEIITGFSRAGN